MTHKVESANSALDTTDATFCINTAMIFAAGHGKRMRPLTDTTPKPLLKAGGMSLIEYHLIKLRQAGILRVVINLHWLSEKISSTLGDGSKYGVTIEYSDETVLLETAGGLVKAIPLLTRQGNDPFLVVNGDVWSDVDFAVVCHKAQQYLRAEDLAMLVMVNNPTQHPRGDFSLNHSRLAMGTEQEKLTYSGVGVYRPRIVHGLNEEPASLGPLLRKAITNGQIAGWHFTGKWSDVGTPQRLAQLQEALGK